MDRRRRWIVVVIVGGVLAGAGLAGGLWVWSELPTFRRLLGPPGTREEWEAVIAELRAQGEPVTVADLAGEPPPEDDNGAPLLRDAWKWADANLPSPDEWPPGDAVVDDEWGNPVPARPDEVRAFAATLGPFLARVDAALARPRLWLPPPAEPRADTLADDEEVIRRFQHTTRAGLAALAAAATPTERVDGEHRLLALASRTEGVTTVRTMVAVAVAIAHGALIDLRRGLARGELDPAEARERLDGLLATPWLPRIRDVVRSERVSFIWTHRALLGEIEVPPGYDAELDDLRFATSPPVARRHLYGSATRGCRGMQGLLDLPLESHLQHRRDFDRVTARWGGERLAEITTLVVFPEVHGRLTRADAASRLARLTLALAEHRRLHGEWPASLEALAPLFPAGIPADPFSDAPFRYERTDGGVRVSSAGPGADPIWGEADDEGARRERGLVWELRE